MIHGVSIQTTMNTHALWHTVAFHRNLQHTSVIPWALRWKQQQPCDRLSKQSACGIRSEQRGATDGRAHKFVFSCSHVTGGGTFVVCLRPFVYDGSQQTSSLWRMVVYFGTTSTESEVQVREQSCRINVSQTFEQVAFPKWCRFILQLTTSTQQLSPTFFFPKSDISRLQTLEEGFSQSVSFKRNRQLIFIFGAVLRKHCRKLPRNLNLTWACLRNFYHGAQNRLTFEGWFI